MQLSEKQIKEAARVLEEETFKKAVGINISEYRELNGLSEDIDVLGHISVYQLFTYNCHKELTIKKILNMDNNILLSELIRRKTTWETMTTQVLALKLNCLHSKILEEFEKLFEADPTLPRVRVYEDVHLLNYVQANVIAMGLSWDYMKEVANSVKQKLAKVEEEHTFLDWFVNEVEEDDKLLNRMTTNKDANEYLQ